MIFALYTTVIRLFPINLFSFWNTVVRMGNTFKKMIEAQERQMSGANASR